MVATDETTLPVVAQSFLFRFWDEMANSHGPGCCSVFVAEFIEGWSRFNRLRLALTTGDVEAALEIILAIRRSSQEIGAERMDDLLAALECEVRSGARAGDISVRLPVLAVRFLRPIDHCGLRIMERLQL
jgi:hypothetical protein